MSNTFEKSMEALQKIANEMEKGNITLEESINKFEDGMKLIKECRNALESAKGRVEKILANGETINFDEVNND